MKYADFYSHLYEAKFFSRYENLKVHRQGNCYTVDDIKTGGESYACVQPRKNVMGDIIGKKFTIFGWYATPAEHRFNTDIEKDYVGGGFARNCMAKYFEITRELNLNIMGIFQPSDDGIAVMNHYIKKGILDPIPETKHDDAGEEYFTEFTINRTKADKYVSYVRSL